MSSEEQLSNDNSGDQSGNDGKVDLSIDIPASTMTAWLTLADLPTEQIAAASRHDPVHFQPASSPIALQLSSAAVKEKRDRLSAGDLITASITNAFLNGINYAAAIVRQSDFSILHANNSACRMFGGQDREQMVGISLYSLFPTLKRTVVSRLSSQSTTPHLLLPSFRTQMTTANGGHRRQRRTSNPAPSSVYNAAADNKSIRFPTITCVLKANGGKSSSATKPLNFTAAAATEDDLWAEVTISELDSNWDQRSTDSIVVSDGATLNNKRTRSIGNRNRSNNNSQRLLLLVTIRELSHQERMLSTNHHFRRQSRYETEFEELEQIGKGGFGAVFCARNKIDGQQYAIKKIRLRLDQPPSESSCCSSLSSVSSFASEKWISQADQRLIREVKTFARISNHPNVVRYYGAWLELNNTPSNHGEDEYCCNSSSESSSSVENSDSDSNSSFESSESLLGATEESTDVQFAPSSCSSRFSQHQLLPSVSELSSPPLSPQIPEQILEQQKLLQQLSGSTLRQKKKRNNGNRKVSATLYIQMQLCPFSDLRRWLQNRKAGSVDETVNLAMFRQILAGVNHIHGQGFVHRDLKPENIFIQQNGHVYLGDFGLTRSILDRVVDKAKTKTASKRSSQELFRTASSSTSPATNNEDDSIEWLNPAADVTSQNSIVDNSDGNTTTVTNLNQNVIYVDDDEGSQEITITNENRNVTYLQDDGDNNGSVADEYGAEEEDDGDHNNSGTFLYSSPEQSRSTKFNFKCDIYALGIILLELFHIFPTAMERAVVLTQLRNKLLIPQEMRRRFPLVSELVSSMISHNPANRPTAQEILLHPLFYQPSQLPWSVASSPIHDTNSAIFSDNFSQQSRQQMMVPSLQSSPAKSPLSPFPSSIVDPYPQQQRIQQLELTVELLRQQVNDLQHQLHNRSHR